MSLSELVFAAFPLRDWENRAQMRLRLSFGSAVALNFIKKVTFSFSGDKKELLTFSFRLVCCHMLHGVL